METTKNTNYRIASWGGGGTAKSKLPNANCRITFWGGGVNYQIPNANYQKLPTHSLGGGELPKTIEHMSEMKFAYIFHKSCINCKN